VRAERNRGCPFFSQLIWGGGVPTAWHSSVTALSCVTCTSLGTDVSPEIVGGTWEWIDMTVIWCKLLNRSKLAENYQSKGLFL
jgi:hypothetical protein